MMHNFLKSVAAYFAKFFPESKKAIIAKQQAFIEKLAKQLNEACDTIHLMYHENENLKSERDLLKSEAENWQYEWLKATDLLPHTPDEAAKNKIVFVPMLQGYPQCNSYEAAKMACAAIGIHPEAIVRVRYRIGQFDTGAK